MNTDIATIQPTAPIGPALQQMDVVPNGTESSEDDLPTAFGAQQSLLQSLIQRYKQQELSVSEANIKLAEIVVEAKQALQPEQFAEFCKAVRLNPKGSKFRKLLSLGKNASRFEIEPERMPRKWTTRYKLGTLDADKFQQVVDDPSFSMNSTAKDIDRILGQSPKSNKPKTQPETFVIALNEIDETLRRQFCQRLIGLMEEFGLKSTPGEDIDALFVELRQTVA